MKLLLTSVAAAFAFSTSAHAQFINPFHTDKTVPVRVMHAPAAGLMVRRVAFGNSKGPCADELLDRMILPDFRSNNVDVIERLHLDQILLEHNFSRGGESSSQDEIALGKILGPSVKIFVNTYECHGEQLPLHDDQKAFDGTVHRVFISRTRFSIRGSIESVDLVTGQVLGSKSFQGEKVKENNNTSGPPEFPTEDEVKELAMREASRQVHDIFFPGEEIRPVVIYDDKDCGLKEAYEVYMRRDLPGFLKQSDSNLEQCKAAHKNDKVLARAYYDAGLGHLLSKDFDKAKELFNGAMQYKGADAAAATLGVCDAAQVGANGVKEYMARVAQIPAPAPILSGPPASTQPPVTTSDSDTSKPPPAVVPTGLAKPSAEERLKKLDQLLKQGVISKKEYDAKRAAILSEL